MLRNMTKGEGMRSRNARRWTVAVAGLAVVIAAACSDSGTSSSPTTAAGAAPTTGGTEPAAVSTTIPDDVATGEPIKIGFLNNEGGAAFSVPELTVGSEVALDYLNQKLAGVNGRPVEVVRCVSDGSPEQSIACANQFVEEDVVAVQEGVDLGGDAILPILADAGIPLIGHVQFGPARMFDANSYYFGTAAIAYGGAALRYYKDQGASSVQFFLPDTPSSRAFTDGVLTPTATQLGLTYKTIYYDPANPNYAVLATTAIADQPDVSGTIAATDGQCADLVSALRDAGYQGMILAASCQSLYDAIGDKAVGVDIDLDHWNPADVASAPPAKQAELTLYTDLMTAAGREDLVQGNAFVSFADTLTLAGILRTIDGTIDGPAVSQALMATKGAESFAGPAITCDHTVMPGNSACAAGLLFFRIQDDGTFEATTDDFLSGVLAPA